MEANVPDNLSVAQVEHDTTGSDSAEEDEETDEPADDEDEEPEGDDDGEDREDRKEVETDEAAPAIGSTTVPTTIVAACGSDRGGCDHDCHMIYRGNEVEPQIECSCYRGFLLDRHDGRTCHGE